MDVSPDSRRHPARVSRRGSNRKWIEAIKSAQFTQHHRLTTNRNNRRSLWVIERRSMAVGVLFVLFILFCGFTHLFAILHVRGRFDLSVFC